MLVSWAFALVIYKNKIFKQSEVIALNNSFIFSRSDFADCYANTFDLTEFTVNT